MAENFIVKAKTVNYSGQPVILIALLDNWPVKLIGLFDKRAGNLIDLEHFTQSPKKRVAS